MLRNNQKPLYCVLLVARASKTYCLMDYHCTAPQHAAAKQPLHLSLALDINIRTYTPCLLLGAWVQAHMQHPPEHAPAGTMRQHRRRGGTPPR